MACYQLHYPRLVRALCLAGAPFPVAEDLAQESFARMFTHWRRVRTGASPAGYAYRTAFRLLIRSRRARSTLLLGTGDRRPGAGATGAAAGDGDDGPSRAGSATSQGIEAPEAIVTTQMAVAATIAAMPPRRRACAVMCLVVGLPTSAAASSLGIAEGTVRKHLGEARDDLRRALA